MKYKRVVLISYYFSRQIGGAEKSIREELINYKNKGKEILVITFDKNIPVGKIPDPDFKVINFHLKNNSKIFSIFTRSIVNKTFIFKIIYKIINKNDLILTQTPISVPVSEYCMLKRIPYITYLRDEEDLNKYVYYGNKFSFKYLLYLFRYILTYPLFSIYKNKKINCLKNSKEIISNSKYMQKQLFKEYGLNSKVEYPKINFSKLNKKEIKKENQRYIGFIGGGINAKGWRIVKKISKRMPNEEFLIVGSYKKSFNKAFNKGNLHFIPKQKNIMNFYKNVKLLLVPSVGDEAFGRVVLEANYLGIPVITSNKGGLPEANKNKENIINEVRDIESWVKKIKMCV